jgi:hypothetical protein
MLLCKASRAGNAPSASIISNAWRGFCPATSSSTAERSCFFSALSGNCLAHSNAATGASIVHSSKTARTYRLRCGEAGSDWAYAMARTGSACAQRRSNRSMSTGNSGSPRSDSNSKTAGMSSTAMESPKRRSASSRRPRVNSLSALLKSARSLARTGNNFTGVREPASGRGSKASGGIDAMLSRGLGTAMLRAIHPVRMPRPRAAITVTKCSSFGFTA